MIADLLLESIPNSMPIYITTMVYDSQVRIYYVLYISSYTLCFLIWLITLILMLIGNISLTS